MLADYASAKSKLDKSLIITDVAEHVREKGHFVKRSPSSDAWVLAEELLCREKISAVFRDALHQKNRSMKSIPKMQATVPKMQARRHSGLQQPIMMQQQMQQTTVPDQCATWPTLLFGQQGLASQGTVYQKNDLFSVLSFALMDSNTADNNPYEPKPFFEGARLA